MQSESIMRETMRGQGQALARLLGDIAPVEAAAERVRGRRLVAIGTGTSWHAANQAADLLRRAGIDAQARESADVAVDASLVDRADVVLGFTHTGSRKRYTAEAIEAARTSGLDIIQVSGQGVAEADLVTVAQERSSAYTASHLGALLRIAQLADVLGAALADLEAIPDAVERAFADQRPAFQPPPRLVEFIAGGIDAWTAAEGALKIRETSYVASEGLSVEQFLHGPSVALRGEDHLVCLDGRGPLSARVDEVADAAERSGTPVTRIRSELPEPLSLFPLTVAVQRIALESAEALGVNPDTFGRDVPGREAWAQIGL